MTALRSVLAPLLLSFLAACSSSHFESPDMQGEPAMVDADGQPRLWVLSKQEEKREVSVGGSRRSAPSWRTDTFFHFQVQAFDPLTAKPLWKKRLLTFGDAEARGTAPSRVIGSSVDGALLGQDGGIVWLRIGALPFAVSAADGSVVADAAELQKRNPELAGLLPEDARLYGFDRGLVLTAADARMFAIRGPGLKAVAYTPPPPPTYEEGPMQANGTRRTVPMRPLIGPIPVRQVVLDGKWLGLYSPKEAVDAGDDTWGDHFLYPYTVLDESMARRTFWRTEVVTGQRFDDRFDRLSGLTPIADTPTYLEGRFVAELPGEKPLVLADPTSVLVWHLTRIDSAGRLALARVGADLKPLWATALPLSETGLLNPETYWLLPGAIVVMGQLQSETDGVTSREPHLVSVRLSDGAMQAWNMSQERAVQ
jgi:hypothetical protein